jgi:hypothetical protein
MGFPCEELEDPAGATFFSPLSNRDPAGELRFRQRPDPDTSMDPVCFNTTSIYQRCPSKHCNQLKFTNCKEKMR